MKEVIKLSKKSVQLTLVEMYAIKHALQKQVNEKNGRLEEICTEEVNDWDNELEEEFNILNKDIKHEKALIARFETEIREFKERNQIK